MSNELARKRARKFYDYHKLSLPVDIETILRNYADVIEDFIPCDGDAICINEKGKPQIIIKKNISENRKRFTYAHELAHLQIPTHTGMLSCHTDNYENIDMNEYSNMESEANAFAAELLMPSKWLKSKIMEGDNLQAAIESICNEAKVSFIAAVYNLIEYCADYNMFILQNKIEEYSHIKYSGTTNKQTNFYINGNIDLYWARYNSYSIEYIQNDTMDVQCYHYKPNCTEEIMKNIIKHIIYDTNLDGILNYIINLGDINYASLITEIINLLPEGYRIKITYLPSGGYRYLYTTGTYIFPNGVDESRHDEWYTKKSIRHAVARNRNLEIKIWNFRTEFNFSFDSKDTRCSKIILRNIIDSYYTGRDRISAFGKVNGVIGSLKNDMEKYTEKEFYSVLKQKFMANDKINVITEHNDFDIFLYKKTKEIYQTI